MRLRRWLLGATLGGGLTAITGTEGCGPPGLSDVSATLAGTYCDALASCCDAAKLKYDPVSCKVQLTASFQQQVEITKRGKVDYVQSAVSKCQQAITDRMKKCTADAGVLMPGQIDPVTEACFGVFKGTVPPGGECTNALECVRDSPKDLVACQRDTRMGADPNKLVCFKYIGGMPGEMCAGAPPAGSFEIRGCDTSAGYCDNQAMSCKAFANMGEMCVTMMPVTIRPCAKGLFCDFGMTMQCQPLPVARACCAQGQCAADLYCDSTTNPMMPTCTNKKPNGAACRSSTECASNLCEITPTGMGVGTCGANRNDPARAYEVTARSCGFGPSAVGPEDAGPVKTQAVDVAPIFMSAPPPDVLAPLPPLPR